MCWLALGLADGSGWEEESLDAYVLIHADGDGGQLARRLRTIPGVVSAESVRGAYDAIALARAGSTRNLIESVVAQILEIPGVTRALPAPLIGSIARDAGDDRSKRASDPRHQAA